MSGYGGYEYGGYNDDGGNGNYGGGFMQTSPQTNLYGSQNANASPAKKGNRERQSVRPVTIKQLRTATQDQPDDVFKIDGNDISQIRVVGCIMDVVEQSTNLTVQIEDGTGRLEVKKWIDNDDNEYSVRMRNELRVGLYVSIMGNIRTFQDKMTVVAFDIRPLDDYNEITHHFTECILVHLHFTVGPYQSRMGGAGVKQDAYASGTSSSYGYAGAGGYSGGVSSGPMPMHVDSSESFTMDEAKVISIFRSAAESDNGLHINEVFDRLRGQLDERRIRDIVAHLSGEGHLYSTIDEQHYKSTL